MKCYLGNIGSATTVKVVKNTSKSGCLQSSLAATAVAM